MTFKKQIDEANAQASAERAASDEERNTKKLELEGIADKLEAHLIENKPDEVGLHFRREGGRMRLESREFTIVIDAGFNEYTGMVLVNGVPPKVAQGSRHKLSTLVDVDNYITGIVQSNPPA